MDYIKKDLPDGGNVFLLYEYYDPFDFFDDEDPDYLYPPDEVIWDGDGPEVWLVSQESVSFGEVPSSPVATPQCFAQLKYRTIVLGEAVHTFWYIQAYNTTLIQTTQYIVDGGPSTTCGIGALYGCGFLNSGVTSGIAPFGSTFQTGDTTAVGNWWSTGPTGAACPGASSILATGLYWTQNSVTYQILGPNSNTFAGDAAIEAGFNVAPWDVTAPPSAVGWP